MRIVLAIALATTIAVAIPACAEARETGRATANKPRKAAPPIKKIQVLDINNLPKAVRVDVDRMVARASAEALQGVRASIDATPAATGALQKKRLTSAQVVAIHITNGVLTLFTKTA